MTNDDPRGPNVIPFGKRTLENLRARNVARPAPPDRPLPILPRERRRDPPGEKPWPFNCFDNDTRTSTPRPTLPPVAVHYLANGEAFHFGALPPVGADLHALESDLENVLLQYKFDHPGLRPLDLVPTLLGIVKRLLRQAKLPSR